MQTPSDDIAGPRPGVPLRVLIAEDHELIRHAVVSLLMSLGVEVVGQAGDGETTVRLARELTPDLVVMDMSMPDVAGPDVTRLVLREHPTIVVVALSAHTELEWVEAALSAGASGYVLKDDAFDDLPLAIAAVLGGADDGSDAGFVSRRIRGGAGVLKGHLAARARRVAPV